MIRIRNAIESDIKELVEINNYYILNTHSTFDVESQTIEQAKVWLQKYKTSGPSQLLVAEQAGVVVGYAYSIKYRDHSAFDHTVAISIYLAHNQRAKGIGTLLYDTLFSKLKTVPLHLAVVGIALPNEASIALHKKFDFEEVGIFKEYAMKNGKYISSIWMQKRLAFDVLP